MSNDDADSSSSNIIISSISTTDDDIILTTTSADSGSFETWTLVTDKQKSKANIKNQIQQQSSIDETTTTTITTKDLCSRVEELRNETPNLNNVEKESNSAIFTEMAKEADDFSDGISIISESSESIGSISPHPLLREHLHDTLSSLLKETTTYKDTVDAMETDDDLEIPKEIIKRRKRSVSQQAPHPSNQMITGNRLVALLMHFGNKSAVKQGVSLVFYVGMVLAFCAIIGQLRYTEYGIIIDGKSLEDIKHKINDLELQNNLMNAEIDLLNKQVNYLTDVHVKTRDFGENNKANVERKSGKTFKAWSGNGNKMDAVHINKDDLKRAYKCGMDGKFVEVGGMCVEKRPSTDELESLIDEVSNTVNDVLQDSETYKSFEKVAEDFLKKSINKNNEPLSDPPLAQHNDEKYNKEYVTSNNYADNSKEHKKNAKKYRKSQQKKGFDDSFENSESHEVHRKRANSKERNHGSKESFEYNNNNNDDDKKRRKSYSSGERAEKIINKNAQWHENLMQQREELRRQRHKHNDHHQNWYIERGDSREKARSSP